MLKNGLPVLGTAAARLSQMVRSGIVGNSSFVSPFCMPACIVVAYHIL